MNLSNQSKVVLSIIIPAYNEEDAIAEIIERCLRERETIVRETPVEEVEIIVVNDGSQDRTAETAKQFKEISAKLLSIQHPDGLWRVNLDDPEFINRGESSGSAFFSYALAWGINEGLLDENKYKPAVYKAWKALVDNVNDQGRLGYVQQVAGSPDTFREDQSHLYASGAFLLAGSEIYKMCHDTILVQ